MAISPPRTWITGEVVTAAMLNEQIRDNQKWLIGQDRPMARVHRTSAFTVPSGFITPISFTSERFDKGDMHDNVTNNTRLTVPSNGSGRYMVGGHLFWDSNTTGSRGIHILRGTGQIRIGELITSALGTTVLSVSTLAWLVLDYVELGAFQDSGANRTINFDAQFACEFWAIWISQ